MTSEPPGDELLAELAARRLDGDIDDRRWEQLLGEHPEVLARVLAQQQRLAAAMRSLPREAHDPALAQTILSHIPWAAPVAAPGRPRGSWHLARWASAALLAACLAVVLHLQQRGSSPAPELVATRGPGSSALPQHEPADVLESKSESERRSLVAAATPQGRASSNGATPPAGPPPSITSAQAPFGGEVPAPALSANEQHAGEPTEAAPAAAPTQVEQAHLRADTAGASAKDADEVQSAASSDLRPGAHPSADDGLAEMTTPAQPADAALATARARPAPQLGGPAGRRETSALLLAQPVQLELLEGVAPRLRLHVLATAPAQVLPSSSLELVGQDAHGEAVWHHRLELPAHDWTLSQEHPFNAEVDLAGIAQPPQTVVSLCLASPLGRSATLALPRAAGVGAAPTGP